MKTKLLVSRLIWIPVVTLLVGCPPKVPPDDPPKIKIGRVDFGRADGQYDVACNEDENLTFDGVRFYEPWIEIHSSPTLPGSLTIRYAIQSDGDAGSDATLGWFDVTFNAGTDRAYGSSTFTYNGNPSYPNAPSSAVIPRGKIPAGAPPTTTGEGFWLGCTKICNLRGNDASIGSDHDNVYIRELEVVQKDENFSLDSNRERESEHKEIWCTT